MIFNLGNFSVTDSGKSAPFYTYTGDHQFTEDGSGNWEIKCLSSGTLTFSEEPGLTDILLVEGERNGGYSTVSGEGMEYTLTERNVAVSAGESYKIIVGGGGEALTDDDGNGIVIFRKVRE